MRTGDSLRSVFDRRMQADWLKEAREEKNASLSQHREIAENSVA